MKKILRKGIALAVVICTALSLLLPMAGTADAAAYSFPEYGPTTYLGEHISADISIRQFIDHCTYGGKDYMLVPAYGGELYIFSLSDYLDAGGVAGDWIYDNANTGYTVPTGIDTSSDGKVYVIGGGATVSIYTFGVPGKLTTYTLPGDVSITGVSVDTYNNVFLSAEGGSSGYVYRLTPDVNTDDGYVCTKLFEVSGVAGMANIVTGKRSEDDYVYAQAGLTNGGSTIYKIHFTDGGSTQSVTYENTSGVYFLSYADGKVFGGHSAAIGDGMIVVDAASMTKTSIKVTDKNNNPVTIENSNYINGVVTEADSSGKSYMDIVGVGICEYDPNNDTATYIRGSSCLRARPIYTYNNANYILTMSTSGAAYGFSTGQGSLPSLSNLVATATANWSSRIMGTGATVNGEAVGPAAYVGGYLTSRVAGFDPDAEEPLDHTVFTQGHAQTDSMIAYNGKIYAGCYSGGYIVEYDPVTGETRDLIPGGLYSEYYQARVHALAAGDNKIFFSTVPGTATEGGDSGLGGCIGWIDLTKEIGDTDYMYVRRNVVQDQILVTLAYDEENNILFGGSSVLGGSKSSPTQTEAYIMVYDVENRSLLGNFSVRNQKNSNSDVGKWTLAEVLNQKSYYNVYEVHNNPPLCISGLSIDPDGKMWGTFYNTVFSFSYDKSATTLSVKREWYSGLTNGSPYSNSGSYAWFPRYFYFDNNGYMYVVPRQGGLYRLSRSNPSSGAVQIDANCGRAYTMGTDGNLYYIGTYDMYRISLNPVSITEDLIYAADKNDQASVDTARSAYQALTQEEKSEIGPYYQKKLNLLQGYECIVSDGTTEEYTSLAVAMENADSSTTITLLGNYTGNITVKNGAKLELDGKTVTGDVAVANGIIVDSTDGGGGITGNVTVSNDNPQLPLLDGSTYRFFNYTAEVQVAAYDKKVINQVNYWFDLSFENLAAYGLLANGADLDVYAELYLDGEKLESTVVFNDIIKDWAAEDHTGDDNWALYVGVTNVPKSVKQITIVPKLSTCGMTVSFGEIVHDVVLPTANAVFGAYSA